jgi:hypothetical protein
MTETALLVDISELLEERGAIAEALETTRRRLWEIERQIEVELHLKGASRAESDNWEAEFKAPIEWDKESLRPLLEMELPQDKLAKAFTPAHQETVDVPAKWDLRFVKTLAAFSSHAKRVIEAAQYQVQPKLVIRRKA